MITGVSVVRDDLKKVLRQIYEATGDEVLIGIPQETASRDDGEEPNNAERGFIHEYGSPLQHIPARPWLNPSVESIKGKAADRMAAGLRQALDGNAKAALQALTAVGIMGMSACVIRIRRKIPPGLSRRTMEARIARKQGSGVRIGKGAKAELAYRAANPGAGLSMEETTPLIDTAAFVQSIKYVIRKRK